MRVMIRFLSALSLIASAPCILGGQNPPAPQRGEGATMPARRAEARAVVVKRAVMGNMMMRDGMWPAMMMDAASMLLGHTGELQLTDAQVTRLASIARRAEARQKAMRARMDSAMVTMREHAERRDGGPGTSMAMVMRTPVVSDADWKAQHEDDKEAFSVVTPDQMATAWEMMRGHHGR